MSPNLARALCLVVLCGGGAAADQPRGPAPASAVPAPSRTEAIRNLFRISLVSGIKEDTAAQDKEPLHEPSKTAAPLWSADAISAAPETGGYVYADYLLWWIRRGPTPPLVTTGPLDGGGRLDQPTTRILFGEDDLDYGAFSGVRLGAGWDFGADCFWGLEISGFVLQSRSREFTAGSNAAGSPLLARPFLSVVDATESANLISFAGEIEGAVKIDSSTQLWGWDVAVAAHSVRDAHRNFDLLGGFRGLRLDETLRIQENLRTLVDGAVAFQSDPTGTANLDPAPGAGSTITTLDDFETTNQFYGAQLGGRFSWNHDRWGLGLTGKIAFGVTHQEASIRGFSNLVDPANGRNVTTTGGVLALRSNIGDYERDQFSVVPELGLNAYFDVTPRLRARLGYTGIYWSGVARPGDQIDRALNTKLIPSGQGFVEPVDLTSEQFRPRGIFGDNGFWAHGLNFGVEFRF